MKPLCIGQDDVLLAAVQNRIMNKRGFIWSWYVALQICNTFIVSKTLRLELEKNSGSHDLERQ